MTKLLLLLVAVTVSATVLVHGNALDSRIVNGAQAKYGDHPYICSIQMRQGFQHYHICGCVIYNANTVITAAHCLDGATASSLRIQAGLHRMSQVDNYQVTRSVSKFTMHEGYSSNAGGFPNDIAVMQLSSPLVFNDYIQAAKIDVNSNWEGQSCVMSGWGRLSGSGSAADTLMKVSMTVISNAECQQRWSFVSGATINAGHLCFYEPPKSACSGDSGGPVRCGDTLTGVTSWGVSTCTGDFPSVYTRLSTFNGWLRENAF